MSLLANQRATDAAAIGETFRLGEAVRGSAVQKALVAASVRMAVNNPTVGDLARKDQDLERQRAALLALLNNLLATRPRSATTRSSPSCASRSSCCARSAPHRARSSRSAFRAMPT
jgi:hypothetical protein